MSTPPPSLTQPLKLGTRASPLAMAQAHMAARALRNHHGWAEDDIEICPVIASGDKVLDRALADVGGKALWTKELDRALGEGEIDFAVHSMKDVETIRPPSLALAAMLPRADVRDRLLGAKSIADIPQGGTVGTSSPRRKAQLLRLRPDLAVVLFRGNVQTRLAKLDAGEVDATLLAAAGLDRLDLGELGISIQADEMLPAPSQGAIGIECRSNDIAMRSLLAPINHRDTFDCVVMERAVLRGLGGTCHSPIGALALVDGEELTLLAEILSPDGAECVRDVRRLKRGDRQGAQAFGKELLERASASLRALFAP